MKGSSDNEGLHLNFMYKPCQGDGYNFQCNTNAMLQYVYLHQHNQVGHDSRFRIMFTVSVIFCLFEFKMKTFKLLVCLFVLSCVEKFYFVLNVSRVCSLLFCSVGKCNAMMRFVM